MSMTGQTLNFDETLHNSGAIGGGSPIFFAGSKEGGAYKVVKVFSDSTTRKIYLNAHIRKNVLHKKRGQEETTTVDNFAPAPNSINNDQSLT